MGRLSRGPLAVLIPLIATAMAVGIGISIGTTFIQVHNAFSEDVTLIVAVSLTAIIMATAGALSYLDTKRPQATPTRATRATDRPRREPPTGARRPNTKRPTRGRSRSNDRRKPN
ncbi:MAG: hypothetical protein ACRD1H_13990 [Vicinamibacterales bacterium]